MPTHTQTKHTRARRQVDAGPTPTVRRCRPKSIDSNKSVDSTESVDAFVQRTTTASGVPLLVEDPFAIEQIGRVLS